MISGRSLRTVLRHQQPSAMITRDRFRTSFYAEVPKPIIEIIHQIE